jgi:predicted phosphodiesterase
MLVAIITDTHFNARKSSKLFQEHFERFYTKVFFPKLKELNISTVIHLGDAFDSRKSIDLSGLEWTKRVVLEPLSDYKVHMITGNHDIYFKNSNKINSPQLLLNEYKNIQTYNEVEEIEIDDLNILLIPWINMENESMTMKKIQKTRCKVAMGHLELQGFRVHRNTVMDQGFDANIFKKFTKVFSGHYHTRSDNGKVFYVGNPYEMFWNDVNDSRGFTIFDTETLEHYHINNPHKLFYSIDYDETQKFKLNFDLFEDKLLRVIVKKKTKQKQFEDFIEKLHEIGPHDLKIIENFEQEISDEFESFESEDTISILNRYVDDYEIDIDKDKLKRMIQDIYTQAVSMV